MPTSDLLRILERPFPGLRPFEMSEALLFFGRERHTEETLRGLSNNHFLAIVGTSGSGKSSLVRAGLLPALYRGYLVGSTTHWRVAVMRPGNSPLANLDRALAQPDALGPCDEESRLAVLSSSSLGLVEVVREAHLPEGESVLVVADQFEEIFRYQREAYQEDGGAEAALFVNLLLQAVEHPETSIYVVLTMRSDFLGDCSQFPGLAEALSRSQYLIPQLTREQRQKAIVRPLNLAGAGITTRLVQQLLNDSGNEMQAIGGLTQGGAPDSLPVLQHALMRTFRQWKDSGGQGDLDLGHYASVGGIENALDRHAELVYQKLTPAGRIWAAKIFRALTTTELARPLRRPTRLDRLYNIAGALTEAQRDEFNTVVLSFLDGDNALLVCSAGKNLSPNAVLDIPHESLIWKWKRLQTWVQEEAKSAEWYLGLARDVASYQKGESGLWRDPNLAHALRLAKTDGWNHAWAAHYTQIGAPSFAQTQAFLQRSRKALQKEQWLSRAGLTVVSVALLVAAVFYFRERRIEESNRTLNGQLNQIRLEESALHSRAEADQRALDRARSDLSSLAGGLSPAERALREHQIEDLQNKLTSTQQEAQRLKAQQDQTAYLLKGNADLATVNKTLQDRVNQLQSRVDSLDKDRQAALAQAAALQQQLDAALRENGGSKGQAAQSARADAADAPQADARSRSSNARELLTLHGHTGYIFSVAYSPDGQSLVSASSDRTAILWDVNSGKMLRSFRGHDARVIGTAFSPDGKRLATSSWDKTARVWDVATGKELLTLRGHTNYVLSVAFSGDGRQLATGSTDGTVKVWDADTGRELLNLASRSYVAFDANLHRLAAASAGDNGTVWDTDTGKQLLLLHGHTAGIRSLAFSRDGRRLATASDDRTARLWDAATAKELRSFVGHQDLVLRVAFSPDGQRVATGSKDKTARLWDTETGQELLTLRGHTDQIYGVAFSPDGRNVATGSDDFTVKIWDVSTAQKRNRNLAR